MMMVGLAILFIIIFLGISYSLFNDNIRIRNEDKIRDIGYSIQNEIILASEVHDGYKREITLPEHLGGLDYSLVTANNYFVVSYKDGDIVFQVPEIQGALSKGAVTIRKVNGNIQIT
ncbi:hypothetical protein ACFL1B_01395 [Nanoarchaeota archaeon]